MVVKRKDGCVRFSDIELGGTFLLTGSVYMKCRFVETDEDDRDIVSVFYAVSLSSGNVIEVSDSTFVGQIDVECVEV